MPYIGHSPTNAGTFYILDDLTMSSSTTYTLKVGTVDITPQADNLLITLDGVVQHPGEAYTVSGSTITFDSAPGSGVEFYGILMGQSASVGPGSIGADELNVSGNGSSGQVLASDGDGTFTWTTDTENYLPLAGGTMTGTLAMGSNDITGTGDIGGTLTTAAQTNITQVGTLTAGTWNGTAIASAYLDADTAHLSTTQTFSGAKTFGDDVTIANNKQILGAADGVAYSFTGDTDTGIQSGGTNTIQITTAGSKAMDFDGNQLATFTGVVSGKADATAGAPAYTFTGDTNTGIYRGGADQLQLATGGAERIQVNNSSSIFYSDVTMYLADDQLTLHLNSPGDAAELKLTSDQGTWSIFSNNSADELMISDGATRFQLTDVGATFAGTIGLGGSSAGSRTITSTTTDNEILYMVGDSGGANNALRVQVDNLNDFVENADRVFIGDSACSIILGTANSGFTPNNSYIALLHGGSIKMGAGSGSNNHLEINTSGNATFAGNLTIPEYIYHTGDTNTSLRFSDADNIEISAGGVKLARFKGDNSNEIIFNEDSADVDFRVESNNNDVMFFIDGGNDKIGIGTASPNAPLDVRRNESETYVAEFFHDGGSVDRWGIMVQAGHDTETDSNYFFIAKDGDGGATGYLKTVSGTFQLSDTSDIRLKENIKDTTLKGIETVDKIKVRDYNWKKNKDNVVIGGFIANELQEVYPQAVDGKPDAVDKDGEIDPMTVSRDVLVPLLVKAVQELTAKVEALENA